MDYSATLGLELTVRQLLTLPQYQVPWVNHDVLFESLPDEVQSMTLLEILQQEASELPIAFHAFISGICKDLPLIQKSCDVFTELGRHWVTYATLPQHDSFPDFKNLTEPTKASDLPFSLPFVGRQASTESYKGVVRDSFDSWRNPSSNGIILDSGLHPACLVMGPSGSGKTTFCRYAPQSLADKNDGDEFGDACRMAMDNHLNIRINYKDPLLESELECVESSLSLRILYQLLRSIPSFFLDYPESNFFVHKWISGPKVTLSDTLTFIENQIGMTVGTARGILFVHLDEINSFLQDEGLSGEKTIAFLTTTIRLVTNSHRSIHRLFLAAIYSATTSAKMVQAAVKSEEPLYIIDLEQLTAIDYVECLESFLDRKFDHGRSESHLVTVPNPIWRLFDMIEGVPKLFAAVLCFLSTPDGFNAYPKRFKEWSINRDMIRLNIEDTVETPRRVDVILNTLWVRQTVLNLASWHQVTDSDIVSVLYSYVMTDEPVSRTSHPFAHQTGSPYKKYTVADLEKDGFLFLATLPAGTSSCHTYRITLPFFFLQMVSMAANSPVPHLLTTHDPTLYWQQAERMDPNGILAKLFAYQQMGKAFVSTSALLPPNHARKDFDVDLRMPICDILLELPHQVVKPTSFKHPKGKNATKDERRGVYGWLNAKSAKSFDWAINLPIYDNRPNVDPVHKLILGQSKMRLEGSRPASKPAPTMSKTYIESEYLKVNAWFQGQKPRAAHFILVTDARFIDELDSTMLRHVTVVDWAGQVKYFGATLAGRRQAAAHYKVV